MQLTPVPTCRCGKKGEKILGYVKILKGMFKRLSIALNLMKKRLILSHSSEISLLSFFFSFWNACLTLLHTFFMRLLLLFCFHGGNSLLKNATDLLMRTVAQWTSPFSFFSPWRWNRDFSFWGEGYIFSRIEGIYFGTARLFFVCLHAIQHEIFFLNEKETSVWEKKTK